MKGLPEALGMFCCMFLMTAIGHWIGKYKEKKKDD